MMSNNTAYLVGFMGSGKSSILQHIQEKTEFNTFDLDDIVEAENSESIENMFKKFGEEFFRQEEEKSFIKIQNMPKTIISLGGGSLASDLIRNTVQQSENSFYLKNEFRNLWQYIKNSDRPLVDLGEVEVMNIYHNRLKSYEQCRNIVDMSKHSLQEASKVIVAQLGWD